MSRLIRTNDAISPHLPKYRQPRYADTEHSFDLPEGLKRPVESNRDQGYQGHPPTDSLRQGLGRNQDRPAHREPHAHPADQPFRYPLEREFVEPDWTRLPGYREVTTEQWESAQWQRAHTVKNLRELKSSLGPWLGDDLAADIERDMVERATMSMLIPPHMINTMDEQDLHTDPVRR